MTYQAQEGPPGFPSAAAVTCQAAVGVTGAFRGEKGSSSLWQSVVPEPLFETEC